MKKTLVIALLLLICIFMPMIHCNAYQTTDGLNNKSLNLDKAIKDGNVVMIFYLDTVSNKTHNNMEIYNINELDDFMENMKKGKRDKVRIVKYANSKNGIWVNKLYDLEYDGKKILDIEYDVYSNPNAFIPSQSLVFHKIVKRDYIDGTWYGICLKEINNSQGASLISFYKSSAANTR